MNLQQRQSSPPAQQQDDLEITAELPVLDVAAYEANNAAAVATTGSHAAPAPATERDPLNNTDTWHIPAPSLRVIATNSRNAS